MTVPWLCPDCKKHRNCTTPCLPVELYAVNGCSNLKEALYNSQEYEIYDYKDILSANQPNTYHMNCIRSIKNTVVRAVLAMLYAKVSITDISTLLNIDRGTIYWQVKQTTRDSPDMFQKLNSKLKKAGKKI